MCLLQSWELWFRSSSRARFVLKLICLRSYFVVKSLHFLKHKNFTYYATKTANQKMFLTNRYLQSIYGRKNIIVSIQIIYRITLCGFINHSVNYIWINLFFMNNPSSSERLSKKECINFTIQIFMWSEVYTLIIYSSDPVKSMLY